MKWKIDNIRPFLKRNFKYFLVFLLVIAIYEFFGFGINYGDPLANYGFSYAIVKGEIPYLDFNIITTPLYAFYSAFFLLFWNNYLMFIIGQAFLVTLTFFFLYKLYDKKSYLILAILIGLNFYGILATYNFMCFSMMIILIYLEKYHTDKNYLIGIFIGLAILSKHTIGAFFIFPTLFMYIKNKNFKMIKQRFIGMMIPLIIFFLYLVINGALFSFIDLCVLGLFDFSAKNSHPFNIIFYISIILLVIGIFFTYKKRDVCNYYLLNSFFFLVPIFDYCHFVLFFAAIVMIFLPYIKDGFYIKVFSIVIIILSLVSSARSNFKYDLVFTSNYKHFEYNLHVFREYDRKLKVMEFLNSYDDAIVLSYFTMQYDIINDNYLDYCDVLLYGNFGYDGINKMINRFSTMSNKYFIVSRSDYDNDYEYSQFAKEIVDYVIDNGEFVLSKYDYDVYYIE